MTTRCCRPRFCRQTPTPWAPHRSRRSFRLRPPSRCAIRRHSLRKWSSPNHRSTHSLSSSSSRNSPPAECPRRHTLCTRTTTDTLTTRRITGRTDTAPPTHCHRTFPAAPCTPATRLRTECTLRPLPSPTAATDRCTISVVAAEQPPPLRTHGLRRHPLRRRVPLRSASALSSSRRIARATPPRRPRAARPSPLRHRKCTARRRAPIPRGCPDPLRRRRAPPQRRCR